MSPSNNNTSESEADNVAKGSNMPHWYLVYVKADSSVSFEPRAVLEKQRKTPLYSGSISRNPLKSEETIRVPTSLNPDYKPKPEEYYCRSASPLDYAPPEDAYNDFYDSKLVFKRVAKDVTWKRLKKNNVRWLVYEDPLI